MSKHITSMTVDTGIEKAYDSFLLCLTKQDYRILRDERPLRLEMERGKPWYSTIFLTPGFTKSWKDHYCQLTAAFIEDASGKVNIDCVFDWKYSIMRPVIMNLVDEEIAEINPCCH